MRYASPAEVDLADTPNQCVCSYKLSFQTTNSSQTTKANHKMLKPQNAQTTNALTSIELVDKYIPWWIDQWYNIQTKLIQYNGNGVDKCSQYKFEVKWLHPLTCFIGLCQNVKRLLVFIYSKNSFGCNTNDVNNQKYELCETYTFHRFLLIWISCEQGNWISLCKPRLKLQRFEKQHKIIQVNQCKFEELKSSQNGNNCQRCCHYHSICHANAFPHFALGWTDTHTQYQDNTCWAMANGFILIHKIFNFEWKIYDEYNLIQRERKNDSILFEKPRNRFYLER